MLKIRIALQGVRHQPERAHGGGDFRVFTGVADRDAVLGAIPPGLHVAGYRASLRRGGRDQVIGVDHGQPGHLLGLGLHHAVVHQPQPADPGPLEQLPGLEQVDVSAEQVRDLAAG